MSERITDRIEIVNADCYTLLDGWPSDAALVTDPPYGIGYQHSGGGLGIHPNKRRNYKRPVHGDDVPFDPAPFARFRWVLLWGADHFRDRLPPGGTMLTWDKSPAAAGPDDSFVDGEMAWTNKAGVKRNVCRFLWKGVACVKAGEENGRRYHPTQKPQGVCAWCLRTLALPADALVIDPFMGSGSLGVACHRAGLRYLGVEIDPEHYATAKARLQRETAQGLLCMPNGPGLTADGAGARLRADDPECGPAGCSRRACAERQPAGRSQPRPVPAARKRRGNASRLPPQRSGGRQDAVVVLSGGEA